MIKKRQSAYSQTVFTYYYFTLLTETTSVNSFN